MVWQAECINCGACIDACDGVMDKMNYPRGLISYTTERNLETPENKTNPLRAKIIGYIVILVGAQRSAGNEYCDA